MNLTHELVDPNPIQVSTNFANENAFDTTAFTQAEPTPALDLGAFTQTQTTTTTTTESTPAFDINAFQTTTNYESSTPATDTNLDVDALLKQAQKAIIIILKKY